MLASAIKYFPNGFRYTKQPSLGILQDGHETFGTGHCPMKYGSIRKSSKWIQSQNKLRLPSDLNNRISRKYDNYVDKHRFPKSFVFLLRLVCGTEAFVSHGGVDLLPGLPLAASAPLYAHSIRVPDRPVCGGLLLCRLLRSA